MTPPAGDAGAAAVIDIGSNSVLLLVVHVDGGHGRIVDDALATTRLGTGLRRGGTLDAAAAARTRDTVVGFARRARAAGARDVWAFATGAVRDAADGAGFAAGVATAAAIPVEVLPGAREATLAYAAAARGTGGAELIADVGGRTTELTLGDGPAILDAVSLPLGALALTETCLHADPPTARERAQLRAVVDETLAAAPIVARAAALHAALTASGGTATSLAALALGLRRWDPRRAHGHALDAATLATDVDRLASIPAAARPAGTCVDAARAAILPAGALVLARLAAAAGAPIVRVSDRAVRHAYLRERLVDVGVDVDGAPSWT